MTNDEIIADLCTVLQVDEPIRLRAVVRALASENDLDKYQDLALGTKNPRVEGPELLANVALGLAGEAGEFCDTLKKMMFHDHNEPESQWQAKLIKELGDVQWYVAVGAYCLKIRLSTLAALNIKKLRERYPNGFSGTDSENRPKES